MFYDNLSPNVVVKEQDNMFTIPRLKNSWVKLHQKWNPGVRCSNARNVSMNFIIPLHEVYLKIITIAGEEHTELLFNSMKSHLCHDTPVLNMRPGDGLLAKRLLETDLKRLYLFDKRDHFKLKLKDFVKQYPTRCKFFPRTFNDVFFENSTIPSFDSPYISRSLPFAVKKSWKEGPSINIICSHTNGKVLIVSLLHIAKNMMYFGMGRPQLFLTVPKASWDKIVMDPKIASYQEYQMAGLLFPDYFDFEILGVIPPPVGYSSGPQAAITNSKEEFLTVRIAPSKELDDLLDAELLEEYLFFGTQTMNGKAKHNFVIQSLERFSADSGLDLVAGGVNCFTKFTDLTVPEALRIFKLWRSSPKYSSSLFMREFNEYMEYSVT